MDRARQLLLAAVSPDDTRFARDCAAADVDWAWILERARDHKLEALVAARMRTHAAGTGSPALSPRLAEIEARAASRIELARRTATAVLPAIAARGIRCLVLKGALLGEGAYGDATRRPFYDIDVVVPAARVGDAERLLHELGYRLGGMRDVLGASIGSDERAAAERLMRRYRAALSCELGYVPALRGSALPIDLHWALLPRWRLRLAPGAIWDHAVPASAFGVPVETLDADATLLYLAAHALDPWLHAFKLLHLCDVAWYAQTYRGDARRLWDLAQAWGARDELGIALRAAAELFDAPTAGALAAAHRPGTRARAGLALLRRRQLLIDAPVSPGNAWPRRAATELVWGLAIGGVRGKLAHVAARRIAAAWWRWAARAQDTTR